VPRDDLLAIGDYAAQLDAYLSRWSAALALAS
jgi:hypothetical protein